MFSIFSGPSSSVNRYEIADRNSVDSRGRPGPALAKKTFKKKKMVKKEALPSTTEQDLSDLLIALQDEFGKLTL